MNNPKTKITSLYYQSREIYLYPVFCPFCGTKMEIAGGERKRCEYCNGMVKLNLRFGMPEIKADEGPTWVKEE